MRGIRKVSMAALAAGVAIGLAAGGALAQQSRDGQQRDGKQPPACGAVNFRPIEGSPAEGQQQAGYYRSRFARIQLMAEVKDGQARNYRMLLNGEPAGGAGGTPPRGSEECLRSKGVATPVEALPAGQCTGARFRVVTDRRAQPASAILLALQGDRWKLCETAPLERKG
jgi:hypothetical protein